MPLRWVSCCTECATISNGSGCIGSTRLRCFAPPPRLRHPSHHRWEEPGYLVPPHGPVPPCRCPRSPRSAARGDRRTHPHHPHCTYRWIRGHHTHMNWDIASFLCGIPAAMLCLWHCLPRLRHLYAHHHHVYGRTSSSSGSPDSSTHGSPLETNHPEPFPVRAARVVGSFPATPSPSLDLVARTNGNASQPRPDHG